MALTPAGLFERFQVAGTALVLAFQVGEEPIDRVGDFTLVVNRDGPGPAIALGPRDFDFYFALPHPLCTITLFPRSTGRGVNPAGEGQLIVAKFAESVDKDVPGLFEPLEGGLRQFVPIGEKIWHVGDPGGVDGVECSLDDRAVNDRVYCLRRLEGLAKTVHEFDELGEWHQQSIGICGVEGDDRAVDFIYRDFARSRTLAVWLHSASRATAVWTRAFTSLG